MNDRVPRRGGQGLAPIIGVIAALAIVLVIVYGLWREETGDDAAVGEIGAPTSSPANTPRQ